MGRSLEPFCLAKEVNTSDRNIERSIYTHLAVIHNGLPIQTYCRCWKIRAIAM